MWQTTEQIELPLKALREDKLNTAERFVVTLPSSRSAKSTSTSLQARQRPNPTATAWNLSNVSTIGKIDSYCEPKVGRP